MTLVTTGVGVVEQDLSDTSDYRCGDGGTGPQWHSMFLHIFYLVVFLSSHPLLYLFCVSFVSSDWVPRVVASCTCVKISLNLA